MYRNAQLYTSIATAIRRCEFRWCSKEATPNFNWGSLGLFAPRRKVTVGLVRVISCKLPQQRVNKPMPRLPVSHPRLEGVDTRLLHVKEVRAVSASCMSDLFEPADCPGLVLQQALHAASKDYELAPVEGRVERKIREHVVGIGHHNGHTALVNAISKRSCAR